MAHLGEGVTPLTDIAGVKITSKKAPQTTFLIDLTGLPKNYPIGEVGVYVPRIHSMLKTAGIGEAYFHSGGNIMYPSVGVLNPGNQRIDPDYYPVHHSSRWSRSEISIGQTQTEGDFTPGDAAKLLDRDIRNGIWREGQLNLTTEYSPFDLIYSPITLFTASLVGLATDLLTSDALTTGVSLLPPVLISRIIYNNQSKKELVSYNQPVEGARKPILPGNELLEIGLLNLKRRSRRVAAVLNV